ncbi:MAG: hypothetical protein LBB91_01695 [Clostridiales bacterium]|jgi:hypothetical protein|nr:hypothetical protein [Clostridiales bacterium]
MKKYVFALLTVCFLLIPALAAFADALIELENDFFKRYGNECVYLGRNFLVDSASGSIIIESKPGSNNELGVIENGETVYLEYSCLFQGDFWGLTSFYPDEASNRQKLYGWVKIDGQLLVLYDYVAFEEDHPADFYPYEGDYAGIKNTGSALAWPWPGADSPLWTIEDIDLTSFRVLYAYKDEQGREWGFVTYLYNSPNIWFCLSEPLNRDIPAFNPAPAPTVWESETAHNDIGKNGNSALLLIVILVAALVIGTIILIRVFWAPNQSRRGGNSYE